MSDRGFTETDAISAYVDTFSATTVDSQLVEGMLPIWLRGYRSGDLKFERAALYPLLDPEIPFKWSAFSEWRSIFAKEGELPERWQFLQERIKDRRLALREDMVLILGITISTAIYNRRTAAQHREGDLRVRVYDIFSNCPVGLRIGRSKLSALIPGDWRTYPPYFPGDQSSVTRFVKR